MKNKFLLSDSELLILSETFLALDSILEFTPSTNLGWLSYLSRTKQYQDIDSRLSAFRLMLLETKNDVKTN